MNGRMCFVQDDDGHWYLIPADERQEFERVMNLLYADGKIYVEGERLYEKFFRHRMCRGPKHYTFRDPQEL